MGRSVQVVAIDFKRLEQLVLIALYDRYVSSDAAYTSIRTLQEIIGHGGLNPIRDVLLELHVSDLVQQGTKRVQIHQPPLMSLGFNRAEFVDEPIETYRLTKNGVLQVASFDQALVDQLSNQLFLEDAPAQTSMDSERPRQGDTDKWEPLKLDRTAPEFLQAVKATEEAIERIEGDNGYASTEPDERNGLVSSMKSALDLLRSGLTSKQVIFAGLVAPLRFIVEKFSGAGIAELAKHAVNLLTKFLS